MARHIPGPLYYEQIGATGTPMLFLHSTPDDHRLWMFQTAHFSAWYRTIAVDLAGYGRSPAVQEGASLADQAIACWELVDTITSGGVIIQGNSFGSLVARHMAAQQPERTKALIISGCGLHKTRDIFVEWKERWKREGLPLRYEQILFHFSPEFQKTPFVKWYADMLVELNNECTLNSIVQMSETMINVYPPEIGVGIESPCLIISGSADLNHQLAFKLQEAIKGSEIRTVEGAGHACMLEKPWDYDRHCLEFLTKLDLFPG